MTHFSYSKKHYMYRKKIKNQIRILFIPIFRLFVKSRFHWYLPPKFHQREEQVSIKVQSIFKRDLNCMDLQESGCCLQLISKTISTSCLQWKMRLEKPQIQFMSLIRNLNLNLVGNINLVNVAILGKIIPTRLISGVFWQYFVHL